MRRRTTLAALAVVALLVPTPAWSSGALTLGRYGSGPFARDYFVYRPSDLASDAPVPLVVYLHGCTQDAPDAAVGTRWNGTADLYGFVVVYPDQDTDPARSIEGSSNGSGCWNWFQPRNQVRGTDEPAGEPSNEPAAIAGITWQVMEAENVDPGRVFVIGGSAGADMAVILGATYPDLYAAVGAFGGCPFRTCTDLDGSGAFEAMGERARPVPMFVAQGTADNLNPYLLSEALVAAWLQTSDLADGEPEGSVPRTPASVEHRGFESSNLGPPDPSAACKVNANWPCLGGPAGFGEYPHTIRKYADANGSPLIEFWALHGLGHNYPGGDPAGKFTDPLGPAINAPAYEFFLSVTEEPRDAVTIAEEHLAGRGDNSDCRENQGTNKNRSNWRGRLLSKIDKHFEGRTFTKGQESEVHDAVETLCAGGTL